VLSLQEVDSINREFERGMSAVMDVPRAAGVREQLNWCNLVPESPFISGLLEDPRFVTAAEQLYGPDVVGFDSNSNNYAGGQSPWHPDTQDEHLFGFKFAFYLQALDGESGALRVLPGSHKNPYFGELYEVLWPNGDSSGKDVNVADAPAFICETRPGDVLAFNYHVWHASWGGSTDRRMVSLQYLKSPETPEEEKSLQEHAQSHIQMRKEFGGDGSTHAPEWVANRTGGSKRAGWVAKLREWGYINN
jgi:hypothetical protein